jgi:hypothetical protein
MGEMRNVCKISVGNLKGRDNSEDVGVDGKVILKWILGKLGRVLWTEWIWLRVGTSSRLL